MVNRSLIKLEKISALSPTGINIDATSGRRFRENDKNAHWSNQVSRVPESPTTDTGPAQRTLAVVQH
jgi:hypothetical protein